jgi:SRSO17 transposase
VTFLSKGVPFAWVAADEVYGRNSKLRQACEKDIKGYVFAVPVNFTVTLPSDARAPWPPSPG